MTRLDPVPVLSVSGVDVAAGTVDGIPSTLLAIDDFSVTWGRVETLDNPDVPTGRAVLFDPSRRWATGQDLIGQPVTLRWSVTPPGGVLTTRTFFRGRVAKVTVAPRTLAGVSGALVTLELVSLLNDLANMVPVGDWPEELASQRRDRIATAASSVLPGGVTCRSPWMPPVGSSSGANPNTPPVVAGDQVSVWEHLVALFDSCGGDRIAYDPETQAVSYVPRRDHLTTRALGRLWWDDPGSGTDREGAGAYARPRNFGGVNRVYLDSRELEYRPDLGVSRDQTSRITRLILTYPPAGLSTTPYLSQERVVAGATEAANGVRALRVESIFRNYPNTTMNELEKFVLADAAAWQLEPVRWLSRKVGGLEDINQAVNLMTGGEQPALVFIQGTYLPGLGIPPVFGVMGGVIGHRDGGWELELVLAPVRLAVPQHAITWEEIDDGVDYQVQLWDTPHPQGLHPSLTIDDLEWVGIGVRNVPNEAVYTFTNYGWDFYA